MSRSGEELERAVPGPDELVALTSVELQHPLAHSVPRENRQGKVSRDSGEIVCSLHEEHVEVSPARRRRTRQASASRLAIRRAPESSSP